MLQCIQIKVIARGVLCLCVHYVYQALQYAAQLSGKAIESWDTCVLRKGSFCIDSDESYFILLPAEAQVFWHTQGIYIYTLFYVMQMLIIKCLNTRQ